MRRFAAYQAAVFLGAFLLFQVQPLLAKSMLPSFGGSYLVWGACMAFYQALLLAGYAAAHFLQRWFGVGRYARAHLMVMLLPLLFMPFDFELLAADPEGQNLALAVVLRLSAAAAVPFVVLAMVSVLLQRWLSETQLAEAKNPYALYAASNLGSLLALLSYPILIEPFLGLRMQGWMWWSGYLLLLGLQLFCMPPKSAANDKPQALERVTGRRAATWIALSASGTALLVALTNRLTFDVASAPFLWVAPLAVYLLTFVLAFKRRPWMPAALSELFNWALILGVVLHLMVQLRLALPVLPSAVLHLGILFVCCQRCHNLLAKTRPEDPRQLTTFYLLLSLGGALGGAAVSWFAPVLTESLAEIPLSLALAAGAASAGALLAREEQAMRWTKRNAATLVAAGVATAAAMIFTPRIVAGLEDAPVAFMLAPMALVLALSLRGIRTVPVGAAALIVLFQVMMGSAESHAIGADRLERIRNFYGIYRIYDHDGVRWLQHGTTEHGRQNLDPLLAPIPLSYYHPSTPAGLTLARVSDEPRRIAMIGLGTGALAAYLREGDEFLILELDPDNSPIAEEQFSYLSGARDRGASIETVIGDGRLKLRAEPDNSVDVLILDAFSSGSVPAHLLTVEALNEYRRALADDGILLIHTSNKFLRLDPLVASVGGEAGFSALFANNATDLQPGADPTWWAVLTTDSQVRDSLLLHGLWQPLAVAEDELPAPWTDSFSNLLSVMRLW